MRIVRDQNGKQLSRNIVRDGDGYWGVNVWFGGLNGLATDVRRYRYRTRNQARAATVADAPGDASGRID